jgi:hypothetical protein
MAEQEPPPSKVAPAIAGPPNTGPPPTFTQQGSIYEAVHGRRRVRYYVVAAHELASISVMSGAASFLLTVGVSLLGLAATVYYGTPTALPAAPTIIVTATLGVIFIVAAVILLFLRASDVSRIKAETRFNGN